MNVISICHFVTFKEKTSHLQKIEFYNYGVQNILQIWFFVLMLRFRIIPLFVSLPVYFVPLMNQQ